MAIEAKDLTKVYRTGKSEAIALRGLNMNLRGGKVVGEPGTRQRVHLGSRRCLIPGIAALSVGRS